MDRLRNKLLKFLVVWGICGLYVASAAIAASPSRPEMATRASAEPHASRRSGSTKAASDRPDVAQLDLRPPTDLPTLSGATSRSLAFPSARRTLASANYEDQLPTLGAADESAPMSRAEAFARRVRREGIPIVRLWEGHAAFVGLGLNHRGKPGLWLIQKVK